MLRKISGATRGKVEVRGDQSRLHNEKIYKLFISYGFVYYLVCRSGSLDKLILIKTTISVNNM